MGNGVWLKIRNFFYSFYEFLVHEYFGDEKEIRGFNLDEFDEELKDLQTKYIENVILKYNL